MKIKKYLYLSLIGSLFISALLPHVSFAKGKKSSRDVQNTPDQQAAFVQISQDPSATDPAQAPDTTQSAAADTSATDPAQAPDTTQSAATSTSPTAPTDPQSSTDPLDQTQATTTDPSTVDQATTTTPATQPTSLPLTQAEDLNNAHAAPAYDPQLEKTLNSTLPPNQPTPVTQPQPVKPKTPILSATTSATSTATTTVAGTVSSVGTGLTSAAVNETDSTPASTDYYTPLDSLSPEATYGLSFLAMAFGVLGTIFIIRSPQENVEWIPRVPTARGPLLEP